MANGKIISSDDGRIFVSAGGRASFGRDRLCWSHEYYNEGTALVDRELLLDGDPTLGLDAYPFATWWRPIPKFMCQRLVIYCPQTLTLSPEEDYCIANTTPTWIFRFAHCRSGATWPIDGEASPCLPADRLNCSAIGKTTAACTNPDYVDGVLPAVPPYVWPSCCTPIDFRPAGCVCMELATCEYWPAADDLASIFRIVPADQLPKLDRGDGNPEQFVLALELEVVKFWAREKATLNWAYLGRKVFCNAAYIIRGEDCSRAIDCATGHSSC